MTHERQKLIHQLRFMDIIHSSYYIPQPELMKLIFAILYVSSTPTDGGPP